MEQHFVFFLRKKQETRNELRKKIKSLQQKYRGSIGFGKLPEFARIELFRQYDLRITKFAQNVENTILFR